MEGLLIFRVYPSEGFRFIFMSDGNSSHEFPVLDGIRHTSFPSSDMNSANEVIFSHNSFTHVCSKH